MVQTLSLSRAGDRTVQAADQFAEAGVTALAAMGVNTLAFGTEHPEVAYADLAEKLATAALTGDEISRLYADIRYATQRCLCKSGWDHPN